MKYDIFRVVYVSADNVMNLPSNFPHRILEDEEENTRYLMQQWEHIICCKDLYIVVSFKVKW